MKKARLCSLLCFSLLFLACTSVDNQNTTQDTFNRKALLENLADNLIIPAYQNFSEDMTRLKTATETFLTTTDEANLIALRQIWTQTYISWQYVAMYEIGKAEELSYRNFMNVYPVSTQNIEANITTGIYNLSAVSKQDEQGFGALDYLLNGLGNNDAEMILNYTVNSNASGYKNYLKDVVDRMQTMTTTVVNDWTSGYRDTFVNNDGSSATSSIDKLVNDFLFHYEKHLRAGKIGIPAGVFSTTILEDKVEAFYKKDLSKRLFETNLTATRDLFNGKHFNSTLEGESFKTYLNFLNTIKQGEDLATIINDQFDIVSATAAGLSNNFSEQIKVGNSMMLNVYDELQKNVVHIKVDMMQAINVRVDFVDADGD